MAVQIRQINVNNNILDTQEQNLVESKQMIRYFGLSEDFIQLYVYTGTTNTLINTNPNFWGILYYVFCLFSAMIL